MEMQSEHEEDWAQVGRQYLEGKLMLGLDLGQGRKALQTIPGQEWQLRWGENPITERLLANLLMTVSFVLYAVVAILSFLLWHWYLALPALLLWLILCFACRGFPHPHPGRLVILSLALFIVCWQFGWTFLPFAVASIAVLSSHTMYYWIGASLRNYAARNPRALAEWLRTGFLRIG